MPLMRLKCNRCECVTNAPSIRPGDLCPHCNEGEMVLAGPVVFANYRDFANRLIGLSTVTIQAGVTGNGQWEVLKICAHSHIRSPFIASGWQPYRLDGSEVFNVRWGF